MIVYIIKRILVSILLIFAVTFICFVFINMIPSDPAEVVLRVRQTPIITEEAIKEVTQALGLDDPYFIRYLKWLRNCLRLDFGVSYINPSRTVWGEFTRTLPDTILLALSSLIIVIIVSIPTGFFCAIFKDSLFDRVVRILVFATTSMPAYVVGLLLMWLISYRLKLLPTSGSGGFRHIIMPSITIAMTYISTYIRLIRNNMLENMKEDYVVYAKVRGLNPWRISIFHILKNSLQSCMVAIGMSIPQLISGTMVVENVFAWPGLGKLCIASIFNRDYPIIQLYILFVGILFVLFNLIFDILQHLADPRIRSLS
ncbi:nickel/cobalt ABC transporter permease [Marinisporobacter balticus]|uniref:Nickel transport system permease protein n=1 Tax=Marinisporobacter balticus TaxID=2018667 RepID=A0A4R2KEK2_9FIRM|nr:nickel/cobalt ABC transporter permease [Marinisporobacter balticus]TCO68729.1 nickel transport system permease protein [Marinisporobacter balticus]